MIVKLPVTTSKLLVFTLILISLIPAIYSYSQHYPVRIYTEADGLANSTVFDIVQDSTGILWIARRSGISSYNGNRFRNYNISDGLRTVSYAFLDLDEKGILRAMPDRGEILYSEMVNGKWKTVTGTIPDLNPDEITFTSFEVFHREKDICILAGTYNHGILISHKGIWKHLTMAGGLPSNNITGIRCFGDSIFIATSDGLCSFCCNGTLLPVKHHFDLPSPEILGMTSEGNKLWLLGKNWLGYVENGRFFQVPCKFTITENKLGLHCFIYIDKDSRIIFGNPLCLYIYSNHNYNLEILGRHSGLISEGGTSALVDMEGNTWITGYRGITKILSQRFVSFYEHEGLCSNEIASALEFSPGQLVFGHNGSLSFYDGKTFSCMNLVPPDVSQKVFTRILELARDRKDNLWIAACSMGLARLDPAKHLKWFHEKEGLNGVVYTVHAFSNGKVYAGTSAGLFLFENERFRNVSIAGKSGFTIRKLFEGEGNDILIATISRGLLELQGSTLKEYTAKDIPTANSVYSFLIDSGDRKWVGTAAGLYTLRNNLMVKVLVGGLNINRPVYLILEDHMKRLWFGTDNGIYRWDGKKLDYYTVYDGLAGQEMNRGAGLVDLRNNVWFGTNNGLTEYRPDFDYDLEKIPPPKPCLEYLQAGKDTFYLNKTLKLPNNSNNLIFHFHAISFIDEDRVVYRYMLDGLDTTWSGEVSARNNQCNYYNLQPGRYRFCLKARNALGIWSKEVYSPVITIRKPFWLRIWFLILLATVIAGLLYLTIRFILINRYRLHLENLVKIRTEELQQSEQKLRESNQAKDNFFSIIAHDLRSPFNVMLGMLDLLTTEYSEYTDNEKQMMLSRLKSASLRTIDLLENLLTWSRGQKGMIPFSPEILNIDEIIHENIALIDSAAHSKDILIRKNGVRDLMAFADRNMINVVIRNLLSNAVKYSFPGGEININFFSKDNGPILISVKDNGLGMSEETRKNLFKIENRMITKGTNNELGTGLGLILCRDFITRNEGEIWVESEEGVGSTFYLTLLAAEKKDEGRRTKYEGRSTKDEG